jgi:hypothetical protein
VIVPKRMIARVEKSVRAVYCDRPNVWDGFTGFGFVVAGVSRRRQMWFAGCPAGARILFGLARDRVE